MPTLMCWKRGNWLWCGCLGGAWSIGDRVFVCEQLAANNTVLLIFKESFIFLLAVLLCIWLFDHCSRTRYVTEELSLAVKCQNLRSISLLTSTISVIILLGILPTNRVLLLDANAKADGIAQVHLGTSLNVGGRPSYNTYWIRILVLPVSHDYLWASMRLFDN